MISGSSLSTIRLASVNSASELCMFLIGCFLRGGWMLEESNARFYAGAYPDFQQAAPRPADIEHFTAGLGIARQSFQIDLALDYSEERVEYILSTVIYF